MTTRDRPGLARPAFGDPAILPGDPEYDEARSTFNATIDRRPAAIVRPRSTADVAAAVRWGRDSDLPIAVRGGGHSVAGHATADGALVIDLRHLRDVVVDPVRRRASVSGGAIWYDVDAATVAHGLAMPGGTFGDTGVGGLALGGGLGFLMGTGGLTCDNTVGAELVTADGEVVAVGEDGDPELLWALRGGGGNFGIVTRFEFSLQPVGPLHAGHVRVPLGSVADALRVIAEIAADAPPELVIFAAGPVAVDGDRSTEAAQPSSKTAATAFSITVAYQGSQAAAEAAIRPLRALPMIEDALGTMTYLELQALSGQLPFGLRHYWKGHFLRAMDDSAVDAVVAAMHAARPSAFVLLETITGAARQEPAGGAAFGQRAARWNASGLAIWEDPGDDARQIGWARDLAEAIRPSSLSGAGYANYAPFDETPERIQAAFGRERFERLSAVKRRYDPDNVFRFNLNIPAAVSTVPRQPASSS